MANTAVVSANLAYSDPNTEVELGGDFTVTLSNRGYMRTQQSVGTSEEAVVLGDVTSPRLAIFLNRDATNYIELKVATGGAIFARLDPGGPPAMLPLGSGAQAPFAIANTAACIMDILILKS